MAKKLKPFDLQAALSGEPVMLRDGSKAFVRHLETEITILNNFTLIGVIEGHPFYLSWTPEGACEEYENDFDIIGMYPKTHIINGFEVPAPETIKPDNGIEIYLPSPIAEYLYRIDFWDSHYTDKIRLERGLVFLNKEDAIANAKALLGINPYKEAEHVVMLPYLVNRGDGVDGHYCICRRNPQGYRETWNEEQQKWCSAGTVFKLGKD